MQAVGRGVPGSLTEGGRARGSLPCPADGMGWGRQQSGAPRATDQYRAPPPGKHRPKHCATKMGSAEAKPCCSLFPSVRMAGVCYVVCGSCLPVSLGNPSLSPGAQWPRAPVWAGRAHAEAQEPPALFCSCLLSLDTVMASWSLQPPVMAAWAPGREQWEV